MKKAILLLVTFLTLNLFAKETLLPKEKSLIEGRLENGFNYSIMYNKKPEKRAEFRLMVKIGSLEEREKERGIAHLLNTWHLMVRHILKRMSWWIIWRRLGLPLEVT